MARILHVALGTILALSALKSATGAEPLAPRVEIEEELYRYEGAGNGAGPMWCHGSTCLVRVGEVVYASGLETLAGAKPLNNCRWMLFRRDAAGWKKLMADPKDRTREPCPLAAFEDGSVFLSANPTLVTDPAAYSGPARPEILRFSGPKAEAPFERLMPAWSGTPAFDEHSYRSFAADGPGRELILFQNIGYAHAEWAFRDRDGRWSAGQLKWPWGADYAKPQPVRICYPNVALHKRAVYFCGVSDIIEPNPAWRAFKKQLTGNEWDYDFRRLFFAWSPDITSGRFSEWTEIASREQTCGWVTPGDLRVDSDGLVHLLWGERAIDERLREKFFPAAKQSHTLNYAQVRDGKVAARRTLMTAEEGGLREIPGRARFHATPDGRLFVVLYVSGQDAAGKAVSENRLLALRDGQLVGTPAVIPFKQPFTDFFTATPRAGSAPSWTLDLLGLRAGSASAVSYARVQLK